MNLRTVVCETFFKACWTWNNCASFHKKRNISNTAVRLTCDDFPLQVAIKFRPKMLAKGYDRYVKIVSWQIYYVQWGLKILKTNKQI